MLEGKRIVNKRWGNSAAAKVLWLVYDTAHLQLHFSFLLRTRAPLGVLAPAQPATALQRRHMVRHQLLPSLYSVPSFPSFFSPEGNVCVLAARPRLQAEQVYNFYPLDPCLLSPPLSRSCSMEYYLDNVMAGVPELALCAHRDGIVEGFHCIPTQVPQGLGTVLCVPHLRYAACDAVVSLM